MKLNRGIKTKKSVPRDRRYDAWKDEIRAFRETR